MKKLFLLLTGLYCILSSCSASPNYSKEINSLDVDTGYFDLRPESKHYTVLAFMKEAMSEYHYEKQPLDDSLSYIIYNNYISSLDPNRVIFLESDINDFNEYKYTLDDQIKDVSLQAAYYIYNRYANNLYEQMKYSISLLDKDLNLNSTDSLPLNRKNANWFKTVEERNNYYNKRVRYDLITQELTTKDKAKAKDIILKRYKMILNQIEKSKSEDAFEIYMNAYTNGVEYHTSYLSPKSTEDFKIDMSKSLEGIGATLQKDGEYTKIVNVTKGSPAEKSKSIGPNDKIIAVAQGDGEFEDIVGWRLDDVVRKIRGPKGSKVRLQIIPSGMDITSTPKEVIIIRDKIVLEEQRVKDSILNVTFDNKVSKVGIITIPSFYSDWEAKSRGEKNYASTTNDTKKSLERLKAANVQSIIIDLRNDGGGSLTEVISLVGLFIDKGPVVQVRRAENRIEIEEDESRGTLYDGPMAVMINRLSASASEIFAAAMQDYGRAVIIGSQSFGKGTVQSAIGINDVITSKEDLGQLNLTIAKFYRINGGSTQHKGVTPDILFPSIYPESEIGESTEPTALPYDEIPKAQYVSNDISKVITKLNKSCKKRLETNVEYNYVLQDIDIAEKNRQKNAVILNMDELKKERDTDEIEELNRYNQRRKAQGLEPVKKGEERPALKENDYQLNEAATIVTEYADKISK